MNCQGDPWYDRLSAVMGLEQELWDSRVDAAASALNLCGCGNPESVVHGIRDLLRFYRDRRKDWSGDPASVIGQGWPGHMVEHLLSMKPLELTEHGTSVYGSWLTEKGEAFLGLLEGVDD